METYFPNTEHSERSCITGFDLDARGSLAISLIEAWGLVTGERGTEDSSGRAGLEVMPMEKVIDRAFSMAEAAFQALEARGWIKPFEGTLESCWERAGELMNVKHQAEYPRLRDMEDRMAKKR